MSKKRIWISAGESSGDMHGAALIKAFQHIAAPYEFVGMGGVCMREQGLQAFFRSEDLSVMGVTEIIQQLPKLYTILQDTKKKLLEVKPDILIVIDAPSFHFPIIKAASTLSIPIYYYISPKVWASRTYRVNFMKKYVRKVFCIFPFEKNFFAKHDLAVEYVGNPLVAALDQAELASEAQEDGLISLLPGSRKSEIEKLLPVFAEAASMVHKERENTRFALLQAPGIDTSYLMQFWPKHLAIQLIPAEERWKYMKKSCCILAASGTATLESALLGVPTIVAYRMSALTFFLAKMFIRVPYVSLANLILQKEVFPEFLQEKCTGEILGRELLRWLKPENKEFIELIKKDLSLVRELLGTKNAATETARLIVSEQ